MSRVIFDTSMSLDGFMAASNMRAEEPLGDGGEQLHAWISGEERDRRILSEGVAGLGAVICGRRTYDMSMPWWGADGPTQPTTGIDSQKAQRVGDDCRSLRAAFDVWVKELNTCSFL